MDHECFCGSNCIGYIISQDELIKYKKHLKNKIKIVSKAVEMNKKMTLPAVFLTGME